MVRICGSHPQGPGSIPGMETKQNDSVCNTCWFLLFHFNRFVYEQDRSKISEQKSIHLIFHFIAKNLNC